MKPSHPNAFVFSGMSVLQCASVALKATVCELESSESSSQPRLHMLRQEQMMETLECLLHMGSYLHTMVCHSAMPNIMDSFHVACRKKMIQSEISDHYTVMIEN